MMTFMEWKKDIGPFVERHPLKAMFASMSLGAFAMGVYVAILWGALR